MDGSGEIAAFSASVAFTFTSTLYTLAGRKYGSVLMNRASLTIGLVLLYLLHWLTVGQPYADVSPERWFWLGTSGIMGFWLGFTFNMAAFVRIGPRLALLISSVRPVVSALLAWVFLGEILETEAILGIGLTMAGIAWVVGERKRPPDTVDQSSADSLLYRSGVIFALSAALIQATAMVLAKPGLEGDFDPLSGSLVRITVGMTAAWAYMFLRREARSSVQALRESPRALQQVGVASITGPVIGASLVLVAVQQAPVGIAMTLSNLMPVFMIPIGALVFHERITTRAIVGTGIAMIGTAILFL